MIKRWIPRIIVLAIVAGGVAFLWIKKPWEAGATPITFSTVPVGKGTIAAQVTANGTLSARSTVAGRRAGLGPRRRAPRGLQRQGQEGPDHREARRAAAQGADRSAAGGIRPRGRERRRRPRSRVDGRASASSSARRRCRSSSSIAGATVEAVEVTHETAKAALAAAKASVSQAHANLEQAQHEPQLRDDLLAGRRRRAVARGRHRPDRAVVVLGADAVHDRRGPLASCRSIRGRRGRRRPRSRRA